MDRTKTLERMVEDGNHLEKKSRMAALLKTRIKAFDKLEEDEKDEMRKAFKAADKDNIGTLDAWQLRRALCSLDITPKTDAERRALQNICNEICVVDADFLTFAFEAIPWARQRLFHLRNAPIFRDFAFYDTDHSGRLDQAECMQIVNRLYAWTLDSKGYQQLLQAFQQFFTMRRKHVAEEEEEEEAKAEEAEEAVDQGLPSRRWRKALKHVFKDQKERQEQEEQGQNAADAVDMDGFELLVKHLQEAYQRIRLERQNAVIRKANLNQQTVQDHWSELTILFESFQRHVLEEHQAINALREDELRHLLIECSLMPRDEEGLRFVRSVFQAADDNGDGLILFHEFLWVLRRLRMWTRRSSRDRLKEIFNRFDADRSGQLNSTEVYALCKKLDLMPTCHVEQQALTQILSEIDADNSGQVSFTEFEDLMERVQERVRAIRRSREVRAAEQVGFSPSDLADLRESFFLLDSEGTGHLDISQLRKAVDGMRVPLTSRQLLALVAKRDEKKVGYLTFEQFICLMRDVLPGASSTAARGSEASDMLVQD